MPEYHRMTSLEKDLPNEKIFQVLHEILEGYVQGGQFEAHSGFCRVLLLVSLTGGSP